MRQLLPILAASLFLLCVTGLAVVAWLPSYLRGLLLPALPLLGVMALTVGLHATGLLLGVNFGLPVLVGLAVVALVFRSLRQPWWRDLGTWPWLLVGLVLGAAFSWVVLTPARPLGATLVEPGGSNDGFAYIGNSAWLVDHPLIQHPAPGAAPVWGYTRLVLDVGFRVGEELDQAAVAVSTGHDPRDSWYATSTVWLLILPGGLIAAASVLRLAPVTGAVAGAISAGSSVVMSQIIYSNSAGVLGLATAPLAIALTARCLDDAADGRSESVPLWLAAGSITALAGVYTEYLPLVALGLATYVVVRPRGNMTATAAALRLLGLGLIVGPLVWFRAVKSLFLTTSFTGGEGLASPFLGGPLRQATSHYVGTVGLLERGGETFSYVLIAVLGVGIVAAIGFNPARRFFALMLSSVALAVILLSTVHRYPYGQGRAVEITAPLVILAGVAGYSSLLSRLWRMPRWRPVALPFGTVAAATTAAVLLINFDTVMPYLQAVPHPYAAALIYDSSHFAAARQWLTSVAGPQGADAMVLESQVFDQVWLQYGLRDMRDLQFPYVVPTFSSPGSPLRYFDGHTRRYAVSENGLLNDADPSWVVGRIGNFSFLDLSRGRGVLVLGATGFNPLAVDAGLPEQWMADEGDMLIMHDTRTTRVVLGLRAVHELAPISVSLTVAGTREQIVAVGVDQTDVTLTLPADGATVVHIHNMRPAARIAPDPRLRSIALVSVRRAG